MLQRQTRSNQGSTFLTGLNKQRQFLQATNDSIPLGKVIGAGSNLSKILRYEKTACGQKLLGELGILFRIKVAKPRTQYCACSGALGS